MNKIRTRTSLADKLADFLQSHQTITYACQDNAAPFTEKQVYDSITGNLLVTRHYSIS